MFVAPAKTEVFTDRPARAATARARAFAEDFASDFAGNPPNVAVTGWRRSGRTADGGAYAVVTATSMTFDAATGKPRYAGVRCCASTRGSWTACHPLSVSHIEIQIEIELMAGQFCCIAES